MNRKFSKNKQREKDVIITIKRLGINGEGIGYYKRRSSSSLVLCQVK